MVVVTLNNKQYLAASVDSGLVTGALAVGNISMGTFVSYAKAENLGELQEITYANQIFTSRNLTVQEQGFKTVVDATMQEAKLTALASVENVRLSELMGK